ncbi:PREDICTED: uncharacterized protein LOC109156749 [Ipomoea nil]|uniref:uncharacterized protein LOC109156749 n=1 Tax=Ipomoea nil TaxID=35883 RepID=UPI000901D2EE|nr:PREDICTED: uncharacterized protein LOC109156749 [Ipomoea nil]
MSEKLSSQRSPEDCDLLERSTKRPKCTGKGTVALVSDTMEDQRPHADVEFVKETPVEEMGEDYGPTPMHGSQRSITDARPAIGGSTGAPVPHRRTYAESVSGFITVPEAVPGEDADDDPDDDPEEFMDDEDDDPLCPTIRLTKAEIEAIRAPWRKALIIKVMGRKVGYAYLLRRLNSMWKPQGRLDLIAIDNDYFLVRFGSVEDLEFAMFEGPWMILDHYLLVKPWVPDFDPYSDKTEKVLVWARIPCLPAEYYNYIFLRKLGNKVGRTIRVDQATSQVSRGMFARICVEVDITKPLISKFKYEEKVRFVAYEGIHMICFSCGIYGHAADGCPSKTRTSPAGAAASDGNVQAEHVPVAQSESRNQGVKVGEEPFGVWMIAPGRKQRTGAKPKQGDRKTGNSAHRTHGANMSRFAPLVSHGDIDEPIAGNEAENELNTEVNRSNAVIELTKDPQEATRPGIRSKRPNIIAIERQILNEPRAGSGSQIKADEQADRGQRSIGSGSRRAAEEDEHVVIRGEQGGRVISSTRVINDDRAMELPSPVWQNANEHHSDPPDNFDKEGDVVMGLDGNTAHDVGVGGIDARAGGKSFLRALKNLLKVYKPDILGLFEPKVSGVQADNICKKLGFSDRVRVEALGFSGGIWVFWKSPAQVTVLYTHPQFILLQVASAGQSPWFFAPVYGSPTHHLRRRLWRDLRQSSRSITGPWLTAGDFNSVVQREETMNYSSFSSQRSSDFVNWIQEEGLIDLGFSGPKLTWIKDGSSDSIKGARLDRALCNTAWRTRFPDALVQKEWKSYLDIPSNVSNLANKLTDWNRSEFGNIFIRKRMLLARLGGIQSRLEISFHRGLAKLKRKLRAELEETLYHEELLWFQKSREEWIASGDRNTAFYHAAATVRKSRNVVTRLMDNLGSWITEENELKRHIQSYYINLFTRDDSISAQSGTASFPRLNSRAWRIFNRPITKEEVHTALTDMKPYKAPGPDGYPAAFYQKTWEVTGDSLFEITTKKREYSDGQICR